MPREEISQELENAWANNDDGIKFHIEECLIAKKKKKTK